jgi:hypothetical protein
MPGIAVLLAKDDNGGQPGLPQTLLGIDPKLTHGTSCNPIVYYRCFIICQNGQSLDVRMLFVGISFLFVSFVIGETNFYFYSW